MVFLISTKVKVVFPKIKNDADIFRCFPPSTIYVLSSKYCNAYVIMDVKSQKSRDDGAKRRYSFVRGFTLVQYAMMCNNRNSVSKHTDVKQQQIVPTTL